MAIRFSARHAGVAIALLAFSMLTETRAQDAAPTPSPPQSSATPAPAPSGQKGGARARGDSSTPASPAVAEQHRLPPDSTTKQTLALPGRTLAFTATAGSIRLFDDKGEPAADLAYTSYQLDGAEARTRPVTFLFNGGPGAASAWLQFGDAGPWRLAMSGDAASSSALARPLAQRRDLARFHRPRLHRSGLYRLQPLRHHQRGCAQALLLGRRRRQLARIDDPPLAGKARPPAVAEIRRRRKLWRHPRAEDRQQPADPAGRRREGPDPDFAGARLPRIFRLQPAEICLEPSHHGGGGARKGEGLRDPRRSWPTSKATRAAIS